MTKYLGDIEKRKFMDCVGIVANVRKVGRKRLKELGFEYGAGAAPRYLERMSTDSADFCTRRLLSTFPRRASRKYLLNRVVLTRCDTTFLGTSDSTLRTSPTA